MADDGAKRLVLFGFYNKDKDTSELFDFVCKKDGSMKKPHEIEHAISLLSADEKKEILKKFDELASTDELEISKDQMVTLYYPTPLNKYYLVYETFNEAIEPIYFWSLAHLKNDWGFPEIYKVTDMFSASEQSSMYGASAQRLGLAQDKVVQYLATVGKMVKDLFQLVREVRWIDERIGHYEGAIEKKDKSSERVLKTLWVDMVDGVVGGQKTGSNLIIMAQQLQFTTLPDLFFSIHPLNAGEVEKTVEKDAKDFNVTVKNALKTKLALYLRWRDATFSEIKVRRKFQLDYLRQHFNSIKMYLTWVKPYLKHIQKLTGSAEAIGRPELISAFEGSMIDIEILAKKLASEDNKEYFTCVLLTFEYRTRPALSFAQEGGYHRGPIHIGETRITWRSYCWKQKEIDNYLKMKDYEDLELLTSIDKSLKDAMDALGADLMKYLGEQYSLLSEEQEKKVSELMEKHSLTKEEAERILSITSKKDIKKEPGLFEPFIEVGKGFKEMISMLKPSFKINKTIATTEAEKKDKNKAEAHAISVLWQHYKNFKKAHGMITW